MNTCVVIVTFNSAKAIARCVSAVAAYLCSDDMIVVVDNASWDCTLTELRAVMSPNVACQVIGNEENSGYSKAANLGIRAAKSEFVLLLNPDASINERSMEAMKSTFEDSLIAASGPLSNFVAGYQNVVNHAPASVLGRGPDETAAWLATNRTDHTIGTKLLIGFCMMIRRSVLDEVGLLDEDLFLGSDDLDLCWRLRLAGYKLAIACDAYVEHIGQQSFKSLPEGEGERLLAESTAAFKRKLAKFYAPHPIPPSEELFGIPILPR